jgi:hypothetical protein
LASCSHAQGIQTSSIFCDDGGGSVRGVWCDGVLHASCRSRPHTEERQAYWIGEKAGEQALPDAKLPTPAALNMMAQKYFEQQGSGNQSDWNLAFEHGYEDGFNHTRPDR